MNGSSCVHRGLVLASGMLTLMGTVPSTLRLSCAATSLLEASVRHRIDAVDSLFPEERLRTAHRCLSHVAVAVPGLEPARQEWEQLGFKHEHTAEIVHERVRVAQLRSCEFEVELLEPLEEECALTRFLQRRGPGLHHIALAVSDIEVTFAALRSEGAPMLAERVQAGARGRRYFFLHPNAARGTLLEIVQELPAHA